MRTSRPILGFIGLGAMGGPMACNLLRAQYPLIAFDLDLSRLGVCTNAGATAASSIRQLVEQCDVVFTSLPTPEAFVQVAENELLPHARPSQIFVDLGTVMPKDVQHVATALQEQGAAFLDAPVSGGTQGAVAGNLRMFVGGDQEAFTRIHPILQVLGDPNFIIHCGESGTGQQVKFVNQLAMGLSAAAHLEALALGVRAGVAPNVLAEALGGAHGWREQFKTVAADIAAGQGNEVGVKFGQLSYFIAEAQQLNLRLPLSEALHEFCAPGERVVMEANRLSPSYWHELMKGGEKQAFRQVPSHTETQRNERKM